MLSSKTLSAAFAALLLIFVAACGGSQPEAPEQAAQPEAGAELPPGHPPMTPPDPNSMLPTPVMSEGAALTWTRPSYGIQ